MADDAGGTRAQVLGPEAANTSAIFRLAGLRVVAMEAGRASVIIDPLLPHHRGGGSSEAVNGAMLSYLLDCAMGMASQSLYLGAPLDAYRAATTNMAVSFVRPVYGDVCLAEAEVVGGGRTLLHLRSEVKDETGAACVHGTGTFRVWARGPATYPVPGPARPPFQPLRSSDESPAR